MPHPPRRPRRRQGGRDADRVVVAPRGRDAYNEIFDVYEAANPGVTVEFVPVRQHRLQHHPQSTGLTGDGGPDVVQLRAYGGLQPLVEAGQLVPLDGTIDLSNFTDNALKAATGLSDGRVYGAPFAYQAFTAFYNKGIFDELGLTEPQTWDEFVDHARHARRERPHPHLGPAKDNWMMAIVTDAIGAPRLRRPGVRGRDPVGCHRLQRSRLRGGHRADAVAPAVPAPRTSSASATTTPGRSS